MASDDNKTGDDIIDIDQKKMDAWNDVKSDYQIDPNADRPTDTGEEPSGVGAPASTGPNEPEKGSSLGDTGTQEVIEDQQSGAGEDESPQS